MNSNPGRKETWEGSTAEASFSPGKWGFVQSNFGPSSPPASQYRVQWDALAVEVALLGLPLS